MRVLIIGGDGYCGWASALHLSARDHDVTILDSMVRRRWDEELGVSTLTPIQSMTERLRAWEQIGERPVRFIGADATDYTALCEAIVATKPDTIVNFGQQRSAPYSMIDRDHAAQTMINNSLCNLNVLWAMREHAPEAHLVKLGTMGEYGTPNIEIEEGFITIEHKGRRDTLPFPKQPGSFYHLSKVADSDQIYFACRVWGLRATDLNQGVVYGLHTEETSRAPELINRFDYDGIFGTALNRFLVQAVLGHPLTVYGRGGQTRAFLNIADTARCIELAVESPAPDGTFRVFNQFTQTFSVLSLAHQVERVGNARGFNVRIDHVENPRVEREAHFYSSLNTNLLALGLEPVLLTDEIVASMLESVRTYRSRIDGAQIMPKVQWKGLSVRPELGFLDSERVG
jgi:UDP-sulfoquinovose synthase